MEIGQQVCSLCALKLRMSCCVNHAARLNWRPLPQLVDELRACGPGAAVDMDLAAQRESLVRQDTDKELCAC